MVVRGMRRGMNEWAALWRAERRTLMLKQRGLVAMQQRSLRLASNSWMSMAQQRLKTAEGQVVHLEAEFATADGTLKNCRERLEKEKHAAELRCRLGGEMGVDECLYAVLDEYESRRVAFAQARTRCAPCSRSSRCRPTAAWMSSWTSC